MDILEQYTEPKTNINPHDSVDQTPAPSKTLLPGGGSRKRISLQKGNSIANQKYILGYKIGQGSFGQVYLGFESKKQDSKIQTEQRQVAIKIETDNNTNKGSQILNQQQIFSKILQDQFFQGFPILYDHGTQGSLNYLVLQLLGPNLQDLLTICGGKFSLKTTILLGVQIFQRLQILHSKGIVFRDVKPQNFTMGVGKKSHILYIIDFGLSKKYRDDKTQLHYPYRQDRALTGTIRYSSVNAHLGIEQSRRDDLEAVCYLLIYFLKGKLPWQGVKNQGKVQKEHTIMQMKLKSPISQICGDLPIQFHNILTYCRQLGYYQDPQYSYIIGQLNSLYSRQGFNMNFSYDWITNLSRNSIRTSLMEFRITNVVENSNENNNEISGNGENLHEKSHSVEKQDSLQQRIDSNQFLE